MPRPQHTPRQPRRYTPTTMPPSEPATDKDRFSRWGRPPGMDREAHNLRRRHRNPLA